MRCKREPMLSAHHTPIAEKRRAASWNGPGNLPRPRKLYCHVSPFRPVVCCINGRRHAKEGLHPSCVPCMHYAQSETTPVAFFPVPTSSRPLLPAARSPYPAADSQRSSCNMSPAGGFFSFFFFSEQILKLPWPGRNYIRWMMHDHPYLWCESLMLNKPCMHPHPPKSCCHRQAIPIRAKPL